MNDHNQAETHPPATWEEAVAAMPEHIGRYRIERVLGTGGFGLVYLAHDEPLQRLVAVKVPHHRLATAEDAVAHLTEARTVASLDHPHIVPVFDVGSTEDCPCFIVSKFIEGRTLAQQITDDRPTLGASAELVATVADALHYAHQKGLVHRDVKPGNILLDAGGTPFVTDFGLALKEENLGQGPKYAGTPAYMSPEQARGEGHRVDGRSDIFSLGVVFYELLVGRRPFRGEAWADLMEQITSFEPRPPRQYDDSIPKELERICLKALSKRASERYSTAKDMADDLRQFLAQPSRPIARSTGLPANMPAAPPTGGSGAGILDVGNAASGSQLVKIVPKGLRSFDAHDADFFLELLPGPRDRDGLPDSIRFWKTHIEEADSESTFTVGLIYGPSGCGKSSLVKAGLLPRLSDAVLAVYVEATGEETEARLLNGLRKRCPALAENLPLKETLAALRRGQGIPAGKKVLLVLDQFEQWLHGKKDEVNTELVHALRQCDGGRVQCVVMVRDDFWMAATRFMRALEVRLVEAQNSAAIDLFSMRHAEKVLTAFGRAFGALPAAEHAQPMDPSLQSLVGRLEHLSDHYREVREGVRMAIRVAEVDPEMALTRVRKVLEYVVRDVFVRRIKEKPGTQPLENLLQRIVKDGHFPDRLDAYANTIRKLGNVGTHKFDARVTAADVHESLTQLTLILQWYMEVERPEALGQRPDRPPASTVAGSRPSHGDLDHDSNAGGGHKQFLKLAVSGLAQEGQVICVRLALFAEMMKGKPWTPATLREIGGTEGVGVAFLEATFSAASAPPEHRYHQKAARAVLKALLPEAGTDIKGHMRSHGELLEASGYGNRPKDFADLIRIMDGELRLITPTDPEGVELNGPGEEGQATLPVLDPVCPGPKRFYQLTHDYLVPSLRDWLTRKQKETRRGRAELLLADRAGVWAARPENRQLPSLRQWLRIGWLTSKKNWTPPQRKMMRKAGRYHAVRGAVLCLLLAGATLTGLMIRENVVEHQNATHAAGLVQRLLDAETAQVPGVVAEMSGYRQWTDPLLHQAHEQAATNPRKRLHTSMALLPGDATQVDYLVGRLLDAAPHEVPVIRECLAPHKDELLDKLWAVVESPENGKDFQRLRAAAALAEYDGNSAKWDAAQEAIANDLVGVPAVYLAVWMESLRPVRSKLLVPLSDVYRNANRRDVERSLATDILADYAADQPDLLADLVMDADAKQFAVIYPKFKEQGELGLLLLQRELSKTVNTQTVSILSIKDVMTQKESLLKIDGLSRAFPAKLYVVKVKKGCAYTITMASSEVEVLVCQDNTRIQLALKDGGGSGKSAFLAFMASKNDTCKVGAASIKGVGSFSLDVVEIDAKEDAKERLAKRQANAAVALLKLNQPAKVWRLLEHSPDPRVRSYLIHRFGPLGADAKSIIERLDQEPDVTIRRALLLSLGEFGEQALSLDARKGLLPKLKDLYRTAADPGLHASAEWLLRSWKQEAWLKQIDDDWAKDGGQREKRMEGIEQTLAREKEKRLPQWYVNGQGQTMVVIPGRVEFLMGAPPTEAGRQDSETQHRRRIGRTYAIAAKSVTVEQYRRFDKGYHPPPKYTRVADLPVVGTSWYQAAAYCNWLSKQEEIPDSEWCYEMNAKGQVVKLRANYLSLAGYRLPTEAEMEYATRAGALTSRYYGETEDLLPKYEWYMKNAQEQTSPVGSLKPNDFGLFDVEGNVITWCQEKFVAYPSNANGQAVDDKEYNLDINTDSRVLRGGSFTNRASYVRSAARLSIAPATRNYDFGFRPARTFTP